MKVIRLIVMSFILGFSLSASSQEKTADEEYFETMDARERMILKAKKSKKEMELKIIKYKMERDKKIESQKKQRAISNE
tara:strand:+ start:6558 stop:6794 length:237 start_codon:yes stop_codon:yes gene_type:complete